MTREKQITVWLSVIVLLIASFLSISKLHHGSLYWDETITASHLGNPYTYNDPAEVLHSLQTKSPQHSPSYFFLMSFWVRLTGYPQFALRAFSMLTGILVVAMIYRLARDMADRKAGLLASALVGTSTLYVFYMGEMRMYPQIVLTITLQLWFYYHIIMAQQQIKRWQWLGLALSTTAALYTHVLTIFPIFGLCLYHLLFVKKDRRWWGVVITLGIAGATFLPWVDVIIRGSDAVSQRITVSALHVTGVLFFLIGNGTILLSIAVLVSLLAVLFVKNRGLRMATFIFIASWGAFALVNQVSMIMPDRRARYLLVFWPTLTIILGIVGTHFIRQRWILIAVTLIWLVAGIQLRESTEFELYNSRASNNMSQYPPYPALIKTFFAQNLPGSQDIILTITNGDNPVGLPETNLFYSLRLGAQMEYVFPQAWQDMLDRETLNTAPAIWWYYAPDNVYQVERDAITEVLQETHQNCGQVVENAEIVMSLYVRHPFPCDWIDNTQTLIRYEDYAIDVHGVAIIPDANQVVIGTQWQVPQNVPLHQYSVAIKLYNDSGAFVSQVDFELPRGHDARHINLIDTDSLSAGDYSMTIAVYNWQTLEHLTGMRIDSGANGREVFLGQFSLDR